MERISELFNPSHISVLSIIFRILCSMLCAGIIGLERGRSNQAAGMRTYMLVGLGAAVVMLTGQCLFIEYGMGDPSRLGAQVVSGVGFLGAGSIIISGKTRVRGLTTAAGLWVAACIGLSIGSGFIAVGLCSTMAVAGIMTIMKKVEEVFSNQFCVYMELNHGLLIGDVEDALNRMDFYISGIKMNEFVEEKQKLIFFLKYEKRKKQKDVMKALSNIEGIKYIEIIA